MNNYQISYSARFTYGLILINFIKKGTIMQKYFFVLLLIGITFSCKDIDESLIKVGKGANLLTGYTNGQLISWDEKLIDSTTFPTGYNNFSEFEKTQFIGKNEREFHVDVSIPELV